MRLSMILVFITAFEVISFGDNVVVDWGFEDVSNRSVSEKDISALGSIPGAWYKSTTGVVGKGIQFDGYTSFISYPSGQVPQPEGSFTVEAWFALGAYPTNLCPILVTGKPGESGFFLGVDELGHPAFEIYGQKDISVLSEESVELRKWYHIAGVFEEKQGIRVYLNGKMLKDFKGDVDYTPANGQQVFIARHSVKRKPVGTIRPHATEDVFTFLDAIIDEIKIYNKTYSDEEIQKIYTELKPKNEPDLQLRKLPSGPKGKGTFGAFYTTLRYYDAWDSAWRVGEHADVVVRFDNNPCKFIFWRGTSYIPNWVTENDIWYNNEFTETWGDDVKGCAEPMSDKQCRHSQVRIIESNPARAVIHWRYALVDNWYEFARVDEYTGWGEWADEYYYIYPDAVGTRKITIHSSKPKSPHEWFEGMLVMSPGQRPDEILDADAVTLINMNGESKKFSWKDRIPDPNVDYPANAVIQVVNTRSQYKPFAAAAIQHHPEFKMFDIEARREVCIFPWWNHWPTSPKACDGRYALTDDLASHSSLTHLFWDSIAETETSMTKVMLHGLTNKSADDMVKLISSWSNPPEIKVSSSHVKSSGYDIVERAFIIECENASEVQITLSASVERPLVNPAFVIKNWNSDTAQVSVNGIKLNNKKARLGFSEKLEGTDLIVWLDLDSEKVIQIHIEK